MTVTTSDEPGAICSVLYKGRVCEDYDAARGGCPRAGDGYGADVASERAGICYDHLVISALGVERSCLWQSGSIRCMKICDATRRLMQLAHNVAAADVGWSGVGMYRLGNG